MSLLSYPTSALVGATDLGRMATFLSALGMQARRVVELPASAAGALYGLDGPARLLELVTPGSDRTVRVVETPYDAEPFAPLRGGPYALDFFSSDVELTMAMMTAAGAHNVTGFVPCGLEPSMHPDAADWGKRYECLFQGPDELTLYITDVERSPNRYHSVLDADPDRVHSELIEICWVVDDLARERAFWTEEVGVSMDFHGYAENEAMVALMYHPEPTLLECINVVDAGLNTKVEFMGYPDQEIAMAPSWPLRGGLFGSVYWADDLDKVIEALPSARFGEAVRYDDPRDGWVRAVSATSPTGTRFEVRSPVGGPDSPLPR
ncbi:MAG: hypothetical protein J7518_18020 [Nocardioidaceae bacterium]|nr:hypothetical protein [Nocardioidaceae bacterium]